MISLPLVERGLRLAARRGSTHWLRLGSAALAFGCVMAGLALFQAFGGGRDGAGLLRFVTWLAWVFVLFEGVRQTADCVSSERREGTLGLLLLTDLRPLDVIVGKLLPAALHTVYAVLAMVPVLGLALVMGGVTGGELARVAVALLLAVGLTLSAGITASVLVEDATQAWVGALTLAAMLGLVSGPLLYHSFAIKWTASPGTFWSLLAAATLLILGALFAAGRNLRAAALDTGAPPEPYATPERTNDTHQEHRQPAIPTLEVDPNLKPPRLRHSDEAQWLAESPALWLAMRQDNGGSVFLLCVGTFFAGFGSLAPLTGGEGILPFGTVLVCCYLAASLLLAWDGCQRMAELRRSGFMELLASTPLSVTELLRGFKFGLLRRYRTAIVGIVAAQSLLPLGFYLGGEPVEAFRALTLLGVVNGWLVGELIALTLAAMYAGFALGSPGAALGRTILLTVVLPWLALPLSAFVCLWPLVLVLLAVKPLLVGAWATRRLQSHLPQLATEPLDVRR